MDSPSAASVSSHRQDASVIHHDNTPSSPFVTEVESRHPSGLYKPRPRHAFRRHDDPAPISSRHHTSASATDAGSRVQRQRKQAHYDPGQELERDSRTQAGEPRNRRAVLSTAKKSASMREERRGSTDSDLMPPPPSARKVNTSPRKTPLQPSRTAHRTPRARPSGIIYTNRTPKTVLITLHLLSRAHWICKTPQWRGTTPVTSMTLASAPSRDPRDDPLR